MIFLLSPTLQMMIDVFNFAEPLEVEYRQPVSQSSDQSNSYKKEIGKEPFSEEIEGQELRSRRNHQSGGYPLIQPYQGEK